jgi:hypothetical protein
MSSQSPAQILSDILLAGTWTNFGSTPKIKVIAKDTGRGLLNDGVTVKNGAGGHAEQAFDGSLIYEELVGQIYAKARNETNRDALRADIFSIIQASSYTITIQSVGYSDRRNRDAIVFDVAILN